MIAAWLWFKKKIALNIQNKALIVHENENNLNSKIATNQIYFKFFYECKQTE